MGLMEFLSLPGQERTRRRDEFLGGLLNYYLGPTGIPERLGVMDMMNPVSDVGRSMTSSQEMLAPGRTPEERFNAGVSMLTDIASVAAPGVATRMAGGDEAAALAEGLLGFGGQTRQGLDDWAREFARREEGMFLGPSALNADLDALKRAKELSARRRSPEEIWNETGWFKGADGKWRFEIDDSKAILRQGAADALNYGTGGYGTNYSGGVLHQPLLGGSYRGQTYEAAYPNMFGDMDFSRTPSVSGSFDVDSGRIVVRAPDSQGGLPIALHELQHAIQAQEGFAPGSSPGFELSELLGQRMAETRKISEQIQEKQKALGLTGYQPRHPELDPLYQEYERALNRAVSDQEAYQQYIRTAGEVEANNVMNRRLMNEEERRATPPWLTQDFPYEEQIVRNREQRYGRSGLLSGGPQ